MTGLFSWPVHLMAVTSPFFCCPSSVKNLRACESRMAHVTQCPGHHYCYGETRVNGPWSVLWQWSYWVPLSLAEHFEREKHWGTFYIFIFACVSNPQHWFNLSIVMPSHLLDEVCIVHFRSLGKSSLKELRWRLPHGSPKIIFFAHVTNWSTEKENNLTKLFIPSSCQKELGCE